MHVEDELFLLVQTDSDWWKLVGNLDSNYLQAVANLFESDCSQSKLGRSCLETDGLPQGDLMLSPCHPAVYGPLQVFAISF